MENAKTGKEAVMTILHDCALRNHVMSFSKGLKYEDWLMHHAIRQKSPSYFTTRAFSSNQSLGFVMWLEKEKFKTRFEGKG